MQHGMNSILNSSSSPPSSSPSSNSHHLQIHGHTFHDPNSSSADDFLDQMLSSINSSPWSDLADNDTNGGNPDGGFSGFDVSTILASKLRQHQINTGNQPSVNKLMVPQQPQHLMMPPRGAPVLQNDSVLIDNFNPSSSEIKGSLYSNFNSGSQQHHFSSPHAQFGAINANTAPPPQPQASGSSGGAAAQQQAKPRVRARRGQATDPHSIAERLRRERIAERMKSLQELVPNANKTDKASMLDEIIDYVKFLQLQVKVLSMSRLGGAASVAPLVADMSSEGGVAVNESNGGTNAVKDTITVTEHHVAKMMEEDMGSAMQYLQGKGLCLMPISLATAISTATCHGRNAPISIGGGSHRNGDGPPSPNISGLSVSNAVGDAVKDSESVN